MIEVKNLVKYYGTNQALRDVSFSVSDGEILGFLGPNGAGKSTTMNIVTGYISSNFGTVTVDGFEILSDPKEVKSRIGYLPEIPPLYPDMSILEYLGFLYDLKKVKLSRRSHIEEVMGLAGISGMENRLIRNLSKGYRQRVGLAAAMLGNPPVLILDEPTAGLDPKQITEIRELISNLGKKHTVILSSHILSEIQTVCSRVLVINKGTIVADDTPDSLVRSLSHDKTLTVRVDGPEEEVLSLLSGIPGVSSVVKSGQKEPETFDFLLHPGPDMDIRRSVFTELAGKGWPLLEMRANEMSLEEAFLKLTGGHSASGDRPDGEQEEDSFMADLSDFEAFIGEEKIFDGQDKEEPIEGERS